MKTVTIEFDGGTPCNIPRLGYGIGYGSFRLDGGEVHRISHGRPMSANAAEIMTLIEAVRKCVEQHGRGGVTLRIIGDSQIALKWARGATPSGQPAKLSKGGSDEFRNAIQTLRDILKGFEGVIAEWKSRENSVAIFGH